MFSRPVFFAAATDPTWTVTAGAGWGKPARTVQYQAPADTRPASGSDAVLNVLAPDGTLWDAYGVTNLDPTAHTFSAAFLVESDGINGTGFGVQPYTPSGTTAVGAPQAGGVITAADVAARRIDHAATMAFDYNDEGGATTGAGPQVPPAVANDDGGGPGPIPQGALLVATGTRPSGLNKMERALWAAAKTQGRVRHRPARRRTVLLRRRFARGRQGVHREGADEDRTAASAGQDVVITGTT